jgi:hypothetical protein
MSVWPHLHTAAAGAAGSDRDRFAAMVSELITDHVAATPVTVLRGSLRDSSPLGLDMALAEYCGQRQKAIEDGRPEPPRTITDEVYEGDPVVAHILYQGDDVEAISAVLHNSPVGSEDVCVLFSGLCTPDGQLWDEGSHVALYAMVEPATLWAEGHVYRMPDGWIVDEIPGLTDELIDDVESFIEGVESFETSTEIPARWFFYSYGSGGPFEFLPHAEPVFDRHLGSDRCSGLWRT